MTEAQAAPTEEERRRPFIEPGWYRDLSNEEYHGSFGFSSSQLKTLLDHTPAHLLHEFVAPEEDSKAHLNLGQAFHTLTLEPEKFSVDIAIEPEANKRTKLGKQLIADFAEENKGKTIITLEQHAKAKAMADSVREHPVASLLIEDIVVESSVYWWYKSQDPDDDTKFKELLKVRPDAISRSYPVLIDLKSSRDASYSEFSRFINNYYYHVSAAMYLEGVNQCKPLLEAMGHMAYTKFVFIVVESEAPFLTAVYELHADAIALGKSFYRRALHELKRGKENEWPGFPEEIRVIELPGWANRAHIV